jgi:hypothetical protein
MLLENFQSKRNIQMKPILLTVLLALVATSAHATLFTDRATFESSISITYNENFETLSGTSSFSGPITMPTGLTVSSPSNDLFSAGPGQSTNSTEAIGSNYPIGDFLTFLLGGDYSAFGADFFQNFNNGLQFSGLISYQLQFFDNGSLIDSINSSVAPNGGSFIGFISNVGVFDRVQVLSLAGSFEVADNVTVGNASTVPEPITMTLMGLGLAGLGFSRLRKV